MSILDKIPLDKLPPEAFEGLFKGFLRFEYGIRAVWAVSGFGTFLAGLILARDHNDQGYGIYLIAGVCFFLMKNTFDEVDTIKADREEGRKYYEGLRIDREIAKRRSTRR